MFRAEERIICRDKYYSWRSSTFGMYVNKPISCIVFFYFLIETAKKLELYWRDTMLIARGCDISMIRTLIWLSGLVSFTFLYNNQWIAHKFQFFIRFDIILIELRKKYLKSLIVVIVIAPFEQLLFFFLPKAFRIKVILSIKIFVFRFRVYNIWGDSEPTSVSQWAFVLWPWLTKYIQSQVLMTW